MKNLELTLMGVHEMSTLEMKETDGGFIWLLVVAGALLLGASSCNGLMVNNFGDNVKIEVSNKGTVSADSTLNGNTVKTDVMPLTDK